MNRSAGGEIGGGLSPGVKTGLVASVLVMMTFLVYWGVWSHGFVVFDDDRYVTENDVVRGGLTLSGVKWAFTTFHASNWHPLTWLSHMADVEGFGIWAGGHHMVSVLLHAANTLLLFLALRRMTGSLWRSGFVAALFGVHPLHVESVAWIAERKDVLSALFFFLCLRGYARYAERPGAARYLWVVLFFALGLLSKPMLVTLPFVLFLLDYWPLGRVKLSGGTWTKDAVTGRFGSRELVRLVWEKVPLILLSAASCVITYTAQRSGGAVATFESYRLWGRISNAVVSYAGYVSKTVWPAGLAVFYPHPGSLGESWPWWQIGGACLSLLAATWFAVRQWRRRPYLIVGWFWYLGMLVPVIGLMQVGEQAMADRYTYLPLVGIFIAVAWGVPDLVAGWRRRELALGVVACALVSTMGGLCWRQTVHWRDTAALFGHAVAVTGKNWVAHNNLGIYFHKKRDLEKAAYHYSQSLNIKANTLAFNNIGNVLYDKGFTEEAILNYEAALEIDPGSHLAHYHLGLAYTLKNQEILALSHYEEAIRIRPAFAEAHNNMAKILMKRGDLPDAVRHLRDAIRIRPDYPEACTNMGNALFQEGNPGEAEIWLRKSLILRPGNPTAEKLLEMVVAAKRVGG